MIQQTTQTQKVQIRLVKIVMVLTNQSGAVVEQTFYEPFGGIISGGNASRYDYEGREFSALTGDYDFRFRKYDPELKIFTQPDAGVNNVYDPQELNRYAFEKNNPYKYVDKDGKRALQVGLSGEAGLSALLFTGDVGVYIVASNEGKYGSGLYVSSGSGSLLGIAEAGAQLSVSYSPEAQVGKDLEGESLNIQVGGTPEVGPSLGGGLSFGKENLNKPNAVPSSYTINAGFGGKAVPIQASITVSQTKTISFTRLRDLIMKQFKARSTGDDQIKSLYKPGFDINKLINRRGSSSGSGSHHSSSSRDKSSSCTGAGICVMKK
jgi:RHS repeat-associated protein